MWELDYKYSWVPKNWCFWTVVLEKTLKSPLDCKEIQPVYPLANQPCIFIGRPDSEAEIPILWPPDVKNWLIWKDPDTGKDWRQEEKGMTDGWVASSAPGTWVWISSWSWWRTGRPGMLQSMRLQKSDTTERLNWTELMYACLLVAQSDLILCKPMDWSPADSSAYGILQTKILESVAISFPQVSSQHRDHTQISCSAGGFLTIWATSLLCII